MCVRESNISIVAKRHIESPPKRCLSSPLPTLLQLIVVAGARSSEEMLVTLTKMIRAGQRARKKDVRRAFDVVVAAAYAAAAAAVPSVAADAACVDLYDESS